MATACLARLDAESAAAPIYQFASAVLPDILPMQLADAHLARRIAPPATPSAAHLAPSATFSTLPLHVSKYARSLVFSATWPPQVQIALNALTATKSHKVSAKPTTPVTPTPTAVIAHPTRK